jgi:tripartite ATP-independent transporter DctM subunit
VSPALATLLLVLVLAALLRVPLAYAMLAAGLAYLLASGQDPGLAAEQILNGLYNGYVLLAVPLFVLAANLMNAGSISERLFDFSRLLVGRLRGGLAQVDILVSVIFSGMSGSAIADAAGPGLVTIKEMLKKPHYSPGFAGAVVVASATIGPIIPPSIPMVLYALMSGASVGALFLGGLLPGLLIAALLMLCVSFIARRRGLPPEAPVPRGQRLAVFARGLLPLTLPLLLLGGIYSGAFTPTEAAAVAVLHALLLATLVYRALDLRRLYAVTLESLRASTVITLVIAAAYLLNYALTAEGVPARLAQWVTALQLGPTAFLLLVNGVFLLLGCVLDVAVMLLVFVPMLVPTAQALGIDLVHFGVLVVVNMMIGLVTPPFGMLLFVTSVLSGIPVRALVREGLPFTAVLLLALLLLTLFPQLVLWLPQRLGYGGA